MTEVVSLVDLGGWVWIGLAFVGGGRGRGLKDLGGVLGWRFGPWLLDGRQSSMYGESGVRYFRGRDDAGGLTGFLLALEC